MQLSLNADAYVEFRKLMDANMQRTFRYAVYAALLMSLILVIAHIKNPAGLVFSMSVLALLSLLIDTWVTLKGNIPLNTVINSWDAGNIPADWTAYRSKWQQLYQYRQLAAITGFISLLVAAVFGTK